MTDTLLSDSWELILESKHRVKRVHESLTHYSQRCRWKLLRGGADEPTLPERVRRALADGTLPRLDMHRMWAGRGTGSPCRVCARPIDPFQIEHEVQLTEPAESVVVHRDCLSAWTQESQQSFLRLVPTEWATLVVYCNDHQVAHCSQCGADLCVKQLSADLARRHVCPSCGADLTKSLAAHLAECTLLRVQAQEVRERAQVMDDDARRMVKETRELRDRAETLRREAEAARAKSREVKRGESAGDRDPEGGRPV